MNYQTVVKTALDYADRADSVPISANMDNFLRIVEARVNRWLMVQKQSATAYTPVEETATFPNRYTLPTDFLAARQIRITQLENNNYSNCLNYVNPEQMANLRNNNSAKPSYCIISGYIEIWPIPVNVTTITPSTPAIATYILEIDYYRRVAPLTSTVSNNWLSDQNPDVYIFGLLTEINAFAKDAEASALWDKRFRASVDDIDLLNMKATWSGNPIFTLPG